MRVAVCYGVVCMVAGHGKNEPDVDEGIRAIIELTATRTAERLMSKHQEACQIKEVTAEIWGVPGTENDGLKGQVRTNTKTIRGVQNILRLVAVPLLVALVLALVHYAVTVNRIVQAHDTTTTNNYSASHPAAAVKK